MLPARERSRARRAEPKGYRPRRFDALLVIPGIETSVRTVQLFGDLTTILGVQGAGMGPLKVLPREQRACTRLYGRGGPIGNRYGSFSARLAHRDVPIRPIDAPHRVRSSSPGRRSSHRAAHGFVRRGGTGERRRASRATVRGLVSFVPIVPSLQKTLSNFMTEANRKWWYREPAAGGTTSIG